MRTVWFLAGFVWTVVNGNILPETGLDAIQLALFYGYDAYSFEAQTVNGDGLTLIRIPHGRSNKSLADASGKKPVIFLQHGLFSSAFDWVVNLPHQSPAYYFADLGYDVFLGNTRGNQYTTVKDWTYDIDDLAYEDLEALIAAVLHITDQESLYYVGHSQGTSIMFARLSSDEGSFHRKIKKFFALAPVAEVKNVRGVARDLASFPLIFECLEAASLTVGGPVFKLKGLFDLAKKFICNFGGGLCEEAMFFGGGPYSKTFNESRIEMILDQDPQETSVKNVFNWAQMLRSGLFRKFDYGALINAVKYNQLTPPEYDRSRINVDTYLFYSNDDYLSTTADVKHGLIDKYNPLYLKHEENLLTYNHFDFIWSLDCVDRVYKKIDAFIRPDLV